jgi:hypothetical protein
MLWIFYLFHYACLRELHFFIDMSTYITLDKYKSSYKLKEYVYEILKYLYLSLHLWIVSLYVPKDNNLLIRNSDVHPYVICQYQLEYGMYIYDIFELFINKDYMYIYHHVLSLMLLYCSEVYNYMNYGIYIMTMMNYTNLLLVMTKIVRNMKVQKYQIYTDTLFLGGFGYLRVYSLSYTLYDNYQRGLMFGQPLYQYISLFGIWSLQIIWFSKLLQIYVKENILKIKKN